MKSAKNLRRVCRSAVAGGAYETSHHVRREHPRPEGGRMTHWDDEYYDDFVGFSKMVNKEDV